MYVRVTALRAAQNALADRILPTGRSLPISVLGYTFECVWLNNNAGGNS